MKCAYIVNGIFFHLFVSSYLVLYYILASKGCVDMVKEKSFFIKDPCSNLELTESQYIEFREEIFRGEPNERIENVISDILPRGSSPEISIKKEDACIECKCKRRIFTWEYCWECGKKFIVDFTIISYWKKITNFFTENNVANDSCLDEVDFIFSGKKQKLKNVTINNFTLSKTKFSKILFDNCKFLSCKFDSSVFSKVVFRNCSFIKS